MPVVLIPRQSKRDREGECEGPLTQVSVKFLYVPIPVLLFLALCVTVVAPLTAAVCMSDRQILVVWAGGEGGVAILGVA